MKMKLPLANRNPLSFSVKESKLAMLCHLARHVALRKLPMMLGKKMKRHVIVNLKSRSNFNFEISCYFHHFYGFSKLCDAGFLDDAEDAYAVFEACESPYGFFGMVLANRPKHAIASYWSSKLNSYVQLCKGKKVCTSIERCKINMMLEGEDDPPYEDIQVDRFVLNPIR